MKKKTLIFGIYEAKLKRPLSIEVNISLWKSDDDIRFAEQFVDTEPDTAFDETPLYDSPNADPEVHCKD